MSGKVERKNLRMHFLTQIPQPMHNTSEMKAILSEDFTSMQSLPVYGIRELVS